MKVSTAAIAITPIVVGAASSWFAGGAGRTQYRSDRSAGTAAPLSPPAWVFAPVWAVLYLAMGVAAAMYAHRTGNAVPIAFWVQLALNAAWSPLYFKYDMRWTALGTLVGIFILSLLATAQFARAGVQLSAWLMAPYLAWLCFAAYLNGWSAANRA